jgi:hypothetical protein
MFERNVGDFEKETVKREREERVFRRRVLVWKKLTLKREKGEKSVKEVLSASIEVIHARPKRRRFGKKFPPKRPTCRRFW